MGRGQTRNCNTGNASDAGSRAYRQAIGRSIFFLTLGVIFLVVGITLIFTVSLGSGVGLASAGAAFVITALITYIVVRKQAAKRPAKTVTANTISGTVPNAAGPTLQNQYGGFAQPQGSTPGDNYAYPATYSPPPAGTFSATAPPQYSDVAK